jgi:hypothetical protein
MNRIDTKGYVNGLLCLPNLQSTHTATAMTLLATSMRRVDILRLQDPQTVKHDEGPTIEGMSAGSWSAVVTGKFFFLFTRNDDTHQLVPLGWIHLACTQ